MKDNKALEHRIEALYKLNLVELKNKFHELYGFACGDTNVRNLRKRLAYKLQEIVHGGIRKEDMDALNLIAERDPLSNLQSVPSKRLNLVKGTCYRRVWKGQNYEARSSGNGTFEFNNKTYKSLSAIAREITGTRWNGKLFFGVK